MMAVKHDTAAILVAVKSVNDELRIVNDQLDALFKGQAELKQGQAEMKLSQTEMIALLRQSLAGQHNGGGGARRLPKLTGPSGPPPDGESKT